MRHTREVKGECEGQRGLAQDGQRVESSREENEEDERRVLAEFEVEEWRIDNPLSSSLLLLYIRLSPFFVFRFRRSTAKLMCANLSVYSISIGGIYSPGPSRQLIC